MCRYRWLLGLALPAAVLSLLGHPAPSRPAGPGTQQGRGIVLELDNRFIKKYAHRATISSEWTIAKISAPHPDKNDGEVHIGGWSQEAGLPGVAEIMNVNHGGKKYLTLVKQANAAKQKITFTGAWRLWGEHAGTTAQTQALGTMPTFPLPGEAPSNPDHLFEIHPVTSLKIGNQEAKDIADSVGDTPGYKPHDAQQAFVLGYERLTCKIIPLSGRTRIVTEALGFNFTDFIIRLGEDPVQLDDENKVSDGHGVICSVYDTDGELLVRGRRMVFLKGTDADAQVQTLKKGDRMRVTGIPRISLMLVQWRLDHQKDKEYQANPPLNWRLPYEMIIVSATHIEGDGD